MITWRKSSYSGSGAAGGQDCVELAALPHTICVRDSKNPEAGHLTIPTETFANLVARAKRDDLSL